MYKSFKVINDFIREIYGFDFIQEPMNPRIVKIRELKSAYDSIMSIIRGQRKPFPTEFVTRVYPLLEVSVQWAELQNKRKLSERFLENANKELRRRLISMAPCLN